MYYIVWKNDRYFIGGIYRDEIVAVKVCNENNHVLYNDCDEFSKEEIVDLENELLDHSGRTEDIWKCSKIIIINYIFLLLMILLVGIIGYMFLQLKRTLLVMLKIILRMNIVANMIIVIIVKKSSLNY